MLTGHFPDDQYGHVRGWGMTLPEKLRCVFLQGASGFFHGRRINYGCRNGLLLVGEARRDRVWHIRTARRVGDHYESRGMRPVTHAWFAKSP